MAYEAKRHFIFPIQPSKQIHPVVKIHSITYRRCSGLLWLFDFFIAPNAGWIAWNKSIQHFWCSAWNDSNFWEPFQFAKNCTFNRKLNIYQNFCYCNSMWEKCSRSERERNKKWENAKSLCSLNQTIYASQTFHRIWTRIWSSCEQNKYKSEKVDHKNEIRNRVLEKALKIKKYEMFMKSVDEQMRS